MKIDNNTTLKPNNKKCSIIGKGSEWYANIQSQLNAFQEILDALKKKVDGRDTYIKTDSIDVIDINASEDINTKNLAVGNTANIQGELNADVANIDTLNVLNDFVTELLHVTDLFANSADIEEADIRSAIIDVLKIKQALLRYDTNQDVISFPSENITQIGDIANSLLFAGLERPTWNGEPIALTSDLSIGLTPNYKGTIETEIELPPTAKIGDFYLIREVKRNGQTGLGSAIYGIKKTWEVKLYFELLNYFNKDEINKMFDDELLDDIHRETDIIEGKTPVQRVRAGCVDTEGNLLATTDDAFMLYGPEGMDNIKSNTSLDDLIICGQYSADNDLAKTITEKPNGEEGAFDIAVGYFSGNKKDIWQLYNSKDYHKLYYRLGINKEFNGWNEIAYTNGETPVEIANRLLTHGNISSFDLPNNYGNKIVTYNGSTTNAPSQTSNGQAMTFSKGGSEQSIIAFDNTKNDMYFKTQFGDWKKWKKVASLDENGYVEKAKTALTANNLNNGAKLNNYPVMTSNDVYLKNETLTETEVKDLIANAFSYKGEVPSFSDLPKVNNNVGDIYITSDTKLAYIWNGTQWDEFGLLPDLSPYALKTDVPNIKVKQADFADNLNANATVGGKEIATINNVFGKGERATPLDKDINNLTEPGRYYTQRGDIILNYPNGLQSEFDLIDVDKWDNGTIFQTIYRKIFKGNLPIVITYKRAISISFKQYGEWQEIATIEGGALSVTQQLLPKDADLNNYTKQLNIQGMQFFAESENTIKNKPVGVDTFSLQVYRGSASDRFVQILTDTIKAEMYFRSGFNPESVMWKKINFTPITTLQVYNQGITKEI